MRMASLSHRTMAWDKHQGDGKEGKNRFVSKSLTEIGRLSAVA